MSKVKTAAVFAGAAAGTYAACRAANRFAVHRRNATVTHGRRIVILGAGFGGVNVASRLIELLPAETETEILLIDGRNYLLFTPMLPEVAGVELDALDIVRPPRAISPRLRFLQGEVDALDL